MPPLRDPCHAPRTHSLSPRTRVPHYCTHACTPVCVCGQELPPNSAPRHGGVPGSPERGPLTVHCMHTSMYARFSTSKFTRVSSGGPTERQAWGAQGSRGAPSRLCRRLRWQGGGCSRSTSGTRAESGRLGSPCVTHKARSPFFPQHLSPPRPAVASPPSTSVLQVGASFLCPHPRILTPSTLASAQML